ncbi:hypothetical protein B0H16DRAFT_1470277 [Mycena metata]|uniref:Uncharacterized protein n=1 Tax=Mycena metata TaxID=1033252 RepID=A0AAD7HWH6_9AGAR|nr:hypothetical protein B0H16DRAFT_1470277 [Mycena metata]
MLMYWQHRTWTRTVRHRVVRGLKIDRKGLIMAEGNRKESARANHSYLGPESNRRRQLATHQHNSATEAVRSLQIGARLDNGRELIVNEANMGEISSWSDKHRGRENKELLRRKKLKWSPPHDPALSRTGEVHLEISSGKIYGMWMRTVRYRVAIDCLNTAKSGIPSRYRDSRSFKMRGNLGLKSHSTDVGVNHATGYPVGFETVQGAMTLSGAAHLGPEGAERARMPEGGGVVERASLVFAGVGVIGGKSKPQDNSGIRIRGVELLWTVEPDRTECSVQHRPPSLVKILQVKSSTRPVEKKTIDRDLVRIRGVEPRTASDH